MTGKILNKRGFLLIFSILLSVLYGCEIDSTKYSPVPQIEFMESSVTEFMNPLNQKTIGIKITFYLIDGDGDVGLTQNDVYPPYDANFYPTLYGIRDGKSIKDTTLIADNYRIPYVGNLGQDQTLKATISVDFEYPFSDQYQFPFDSVYYSFYMLDRALHESNIAWSDTIVIPN